MLPDLLFVTLFAIAAPAIDYSVFWPAHRRLYQANPARARRWLWGSTMVSLWTLLALGLALWTASNRSFASLGLTLPEGWRLWGGIALAMSFAAYQALGVTVLLRSPEQRAGLRHRFNALETVLPHTQPELQWFAGVSLTAGFCEEFLYRGYFIWALTPWLGWWGAAALSLPFFAAAHAYQGWTGILRTGAVGAFFTLLVAVFESLWPAISVHALIDLGSGAMAWVVLREGQATRPEVRGEA